MLSRRQIHSSLLCTVVLALGLAGPQLASAAYRDFCTSVPSACHYTGPDAPVLAANVCWSKSTGIATVMSGGCPTGSWPYFVKYGIVDVFGVVTAFIPLDDACSRPGICQPGYLAPPSTNEAPICCPDDCWPADSPACVGQDEFLFCDDGVSNEDGTVTCFEETPA